ncbi:hypothetical protein [Streptomyces sp. IB201691-2A2]|nr:hypothetical protein [Streptomyces sp. IB201691-2A2]
MPVGRLLVTDFVLEDGKFFEEVVYVFDGGVVNEENQTKFGPRRMS